MAKTNKTESQDWGDESKSSTTTTPAPDPARLPEQVVAQTGDAIKRRKIEADEPAADAIAAAISEVEAKLKNATSAQVSALLRVCRDALPANRVERKIQRLCEAIIIARWQQLTQTPPAPVCDNNAVNDARRSYAEAHGPAWRNKRVALLERRRDTMTPMPPVNETFSPAWFGRDPVALVKTLSPQLDAALTLARLDLIQWEIERLKNFDMLQPTERIAEIQRDLEDTRDAEKIRSMTLEMAGLRAPEQHDITARCRASMTELFSKFETSCRAAVDCAVDALKLLGDRARLREGEFFDEFGLAHETTTLSRRFDDAAKRLQSASVNKDSLRVLFGVDDIE